MIGLLYHINRNYKDSIIVGLLFVMTGLAIVVYLNQTPISLVNGTTPMRGPSWHLRYGSDLA